MKHIYFLTAIFCLISFSAFSQKRIPSEIIPATALEKQELSKLFRNFKVIQLDLEQLNREVSGNRPQRVILNVGGAKDVDMEIFPHDIISTDFRAVIVDDEGEKEVELMSRTFQGLETDTPHEIRLTLSDNFIYGGIETDEGMLMISQIKNTLKDKAIGPNRLVVYRSRDVIENDLGCGTDDQIKSDGFIENNLMANSSSSGCNIVELNLDCDTEYWNSYTDAFDQMLAEINLIQGVYENQLNTVLSVSNMHAFIGSMYSSTNTATIINEIKSIWSSSPYSYELRDMVHHFTGKTTNYAGQASSIGATCNETTPAVVTMDRTDMHQTLAHEIGHMLGGIHDDGNNCGTPYQRTIMCQGADKQMNFSTASINRITNFVDPKSCFNYNSVNISGDSEMCINNTRTYSLTHFEQTAGTTVTWSTNSRLSIQSGQGTASVVVKGVSNGTGTLTAVLNYPGSCGSVTETKTIKVGPPIIGISVSGPDQYGWISATANSGSSPWTWTFNGSTTWTSTSATTSKYVGCNGGYLYVQSSNTCGQGSGSTFVSGCSGGYYTVVYPNPATSEITISRKADSQTLSGSVLMLEENLKIDLFDFSGNKVKSVRTNKNTADIKIKLDGFPKGNYFLKIKGRDIDETHSIIVE